jgi:dihydroneopterin aldolase
MGYIELKKMTFHAFHGVYQEERTAGNTYTVDLRLYFDMDRPAKSDCLNDTVDYSAAYDAVKYEMSIPSSLIENVAARIVAALKSKFPEIKKIKIRLAKAHPPVKGQMEEAAVVFSA